MHLNYKQQKRFWSDWKAAQLAQGWIKPNRPAAASDSLSASGGEGRGEVAQSSLLTPAQIENERYSLLRRAGFESLRDVDHLEGFDRVLAELAALAKPDSVDAQLRQANMPATRAAWTIAKIKGDIAKVSPGNNYLRKVMLGKFATEDWNTLSRDQLIQLLATLRNRKKSARLSKTPTADPASAGPLRVRPGGVRIRHPLLIMRPQTTLFEDQRLSLESSLEITAQSLTTYGAKYDHWAIAFSGGKDSSATVVAVVWLIRNGHIPAPKSITVLLSDTRMELPPLFITAMKLLEELRASGVKTIVVMPKMEERFFVYMLGRGVPPPSNTFRWCTGQLKVNPMIEALRALRDEYGQKFLMLTGVRVGESAARDGRIALACGKNNSECGQGWFQESTPDDVADTLAPLLHWRLCHVWDWLTGMHGLDPHGFSTSLIAAVYGQDENLETHARTGCIACNLASQDFALIEIIKRPQWSQYRPLLELRALYAELKLPRNRLRKDGSETRVDGSLVSNPCRMGPLTFEARRLGLARVKDIQSRAGVDLINAEEEAVILRLIESQTWPRGWAGTEPIASDPFDNVNPDGSVQPIFRELL